MFVESLQELIFIIWTLVGRCSFAAMAADQKESAVSLLLQALIELRTMGQPMATQDTERLAQGMCNHFAKRFGDQFSEINLANLNWAEAPECLRVFYWNSLPDFFSCDRCKQEILKLRYACFNVENYDLCDACYQAFQRGETELPSNYLFLMTETEFHWEEPEQELARVPGKCPRKANMISEKTFALENGPEQEEEEEEEDDQTKIVRLQMENERKDYIIEEQCREIKRLKAASCLIVTGELRKDHHIIGEMGVFNCN